MSKSRGKQLLHPQKGWIGEESKPSFWDALLRSAEKLGTGLVDKVRDLGPSYTYSYPSTGAEAVGPNTQPTPPQAQAAQQPAATTQQPTPAPQVLGANDQPFYFDASPYGDPIRQPDSKIAPILRQAFPQEATKAAIASLFESGYNPEATYTNTSGKYAGSEDRGLFQINSETFKDFMNRKGDLLRSAGINSYEDMWDPDLNAAMARIIRDEQGWGAWYGPPNYGYDLSK